MPTPITLAQRVREFASLLTNRRGETLDAWITTVDNDDLPSLHAFVHGLRMDSPSYEATVYIAAINEGYEPTSIHGLSRGRVPPTAGSTNIEV